MNGSDLIAAARWQCVKKVPYLARAIWALIPVPTDQVPTFAVDGKWRMYYNPAYAAECAKNGTLSSAIVHEALHPTLRHETRAKTINARDPERANRAADKEINARLADAKLKIGEGWERAEKGFERLTFEEHYKRADKSSSKPQCGCAGGTGAGTGPKPWERPAPGAKPPPPGLSEAESEVVRAQVASAIQKHVAAKGIGSVPAGLARWAETYSDAPPIDWGVMLSIRARRAVDAKRGPIPSYARPSRRHGGGGLVLPVHRLPIASVVVVVDTSGSMDVRDIGDALGVIVDACRVLGRILVVACDARATEPIEVRDVEELRDALLGGGGTDMCVGIAQAESVAPDAIVVVTDGGTGWPIEEPSAPVIIVMTRPGQIGPPWAEVIEAA